MPFCRQLRVARHRMHNLRKLLQTMEQARSEGVLPRLPLELEELARELQATEEEEADADADADAVAEPAGSSVTLTRRAHQPPPPRPASLPPGASPANSSASARSLASTATSTAAGAPASARPAAPPASSASASASSSVSASKSKPATGASAAGRSPRDASGLSAYMRGQVSLAELEGDSEDESRAAEEVREVRRLGRRAGVGADADERSDESASDEQNEEPATSREAAASTRPKTSRGRSLRALVPAANGAPGTSPLSQDPLASARFLNLLNRCVHVPLQ